MLYNTRIWDFPFRIINHRISLIILFPLKQFMLKAEGTVFQFAKHIIKIFIYHTGVKYLIKGICFSGFCFRCKRTVIFFLNIIIKIRVQANRNTCKHFFRNSRVATHGNSLVSVVKVIIIICKPKRKTFDNKRRKLLAVSSPLLFRIAFYQFLVYIGSCKRQGLFLQILRIGNMKLFNLLLYLCFCL